MSPADRRGGLSHRVVLGGLALTLGLGLAVGGYFYVKFVQFTRVAASHIPQSFSAAVRIDVEQVILFEPIRRSLFPLLNELPTPSPPSDPRLLRVERDAELELAVDLRELLLAWNAKGDWLAVVAGKFPKQGVAQVIAAEHARAIQGRIEPLTLQGATEAFQLNPHLILAQAADGALLLGNRHAIELGLRSEGNLLPREGPGAVAISGREWSLSAEALARAAWPNAEVAAGLTSLAGVKGKLEIGSEVTLLLEIRAQAGMRLEKVQLLELLEAVANRHHLAPLPRAVVRIEQLQAGTARARVDWPREAMLAYAEAAAQGILAHASPSTPQP